MLDKTQVLDDYFPEVRAWLIQIAAVVDRYERAEGAAPDGDARMDCLAQSLKVLSDTTSATDRAERIQMIFSDPVD